jgi:hypothetical protein
MALVERRCQFTPHGSGRRDAKKGSPFQINFPPFAKNPRKKERKKEMFQSFEEVPWSWRGFHVSFVSALFIRTPTNTLSIAHDLCTDNTFTFAHYFQALDDTTRSWLNPTSSTIQV